MKILRITRSSLDASNTKVAADWAAKQARKSKAQQDENLRLHMPLEWAKRQREAKSNH